MSEEANPELHSGTSANAQASVGALVPYAVRVNASLVRRGLWPRLRAMAADLPLAEDAAALWFCVMDGETPRSTKIMLVGALAWFVVPPPLRPRKLPIEGLMGMADDAAVIAAALALARRSIKDQHREAARTALYRMRWA